MNEAKPFASLSSTLLARKGQAKPAMRPQGFHMAHEAPFQIDPFQHADHDDLGWNDMGHGAEPVALHPNVPVESPSEPPAVVSQQRELLREFVPVAAPVVVPLPTPRAQPGSHGKAAFTLRLDSERHLRLRLVCAVQHRSAQQIVTQALDEFLDRQPDNAALAGKTAK